MKQKEYEITFDEKVLLYLSSLEKSISIKILKKINQLKTKFSSRHLKKSEYFVENVGQYRIVFRAYEKEKYIVFIGKHKEYEKWYKSLF